MIRLFGMSIGESCDVWAWVSGLGQTEQTSGLSQGHAKVYYARQEKSSKLGIGDVDWEHVSREQALSQVGAGRSHFATATGSSSSSLRFPSFVRLVCMPTFTYLQDTTYETVR